MTTVGIAATRFGPGHPAPGSGSLVFDNAEKGNMVFRLMVGLTAVGVERVLMMPAASGSSTDWTATGAPTPPAKSSGLAELELVEMTVRHGARDTAYAVGKMCERGVSSIVVLGGDGTNRVVARHCDPNIPLHALHRHQQHLPQDAGGDGRGTGDRAGRDRASRDEALRREKILYVYIDGEPDRDCALVEVAVNSERFVGARALWRAEDISEIVVASASPEAVGLSSIAGLLGPGRALDAPRSLCPARPSGDADTVLTVPLAPGLIAPVGVVESRRVEPGESVELEPKVGSLALDGEREIEIGPQNEVKVRLESNGPLTINVGEAMREAARSGLLDGAP